MTNNKEKKGLDSIEKLVKECVAKQSLKEFAKKVIQENTATEFFARRVLNIYPLNEQPAVLDRLVDLVLCDSTTYQKVYDEKSAKPLEFFMLIHAYSIRQKLGLDKELSLGIYPF